MKLRGNLALALQTATLLSKAESNTASAPELAALRVFTPLAKLFTSKDCLQIVSEGIEGIGGLGYTEASNIPVYLRDAQLMPIWEGSTNVLCLDVYRAIRKLGSRGLEDFLLWSRTIIDRCYRARADEIRSDRTYVKSMKYLIAVKAELDTVLFDLAEGKNLEIRYHFGLRDIVMALGFVSIGVILFRFCTEYEDGEGDYPTKLNHITTFVEWVRRMDFPELWMFSKVKQLGEEDFEARKSLGLVGVDHSMITNSKRPRF